MIRNIPFTYQKHFIQRLGILLSTNIPLAYAVDVLLNMEKNKVIKNKLHIIKENIQKGVSLGNSLQLKEINFNKEIINIIKNGESSGTLSVSLKKAYQDIERRDEIKKKIIGALIYPIFILFATLCMTLFLIMFIFPKIFPLLNSLNIKLPFITRLISGIYKYILNYGFITSIVLIMVVFISVFLYKKYHVIREKTERIILKMPILGISKIKYTISNHFYSIAIMLEHEISLSSILDQDSKSHKSILYRKAILHCKSGVERGVSFSECMKTCEYKIPTFVSDIVLIGEKTGNLSNMIHNVAKIYENEVEDFIKRLSVTIEPILMIIMGLVVGSVALSIVLPIYEITNHIQK